MPRPPVLLGALRGRDCDHARNLAGLREDARPPRAVDARWPPGAHLMTVEDRLREAIADHVARVPTPPDAWDDVENRAARARRRAWVRGSGLAAVGLVGAAAAVILFVGVGDGPSSTRHVLTSPGPTTQTTVTALPAVTAPGRPRTPTTTRTTPSSAAPAPAVAYVPLWPFRSQAEAEAWRTTGGGHQPWHLDPD